MKRIALLAATIALLGIAPQAQALSLPCGLPSSQPLWVDFADSSVGFRMTVFGRSGLVLASNGIEGPAQLRALGAQTVYWHMKLGRLVGTPTVPVDPTLVPAEVEEHYGKAVASTGCATPVMALNELNGVHRPTPWTPETARYRQNVLDLIKGLSAKGAIPFLLIPGTARGSRAPYVGGDAQAWWLEVAKYAYLVRQVHFNAPFIYGKGPIVGARTRRIAMRDAVGSFIAAGVPAERMGLLLGFQSGPGKGGREGLQPRAAWFEIIKQDALAARQVSGELGVSSIWSWGWGTFDEAGADPDKPDAACVYLWTRDQTLCDGLTAAGPGFNSSLTLGQILLPAGVQCDTDVGRITQAAVEQLAGVTGSRQTAMTALLNRLIYAGEGVTATPADIDHVLTSLITRSFGEDAVAYQSALTQAGLTPPLARTLVADQLRRQQYEAIVQVRYGTPAPRDFLEWRQRQELRKTICVRDELPGPDVIEWSSEVPFLAVPPGSVSIRSNRQRVRNGARVVLSGRVESELASEVVTVYTRKVGADIFSPLGTVRPDEAGRWSLSVKPPLGTTSYKAVSKSAASFAVTIRTRKR